MRGNDVGEGYRAVATVQTQPAAVPWPDANLVGMTNYFLFTISFPWLVQIPILTVVHEVPECKAVSASCAHQYCIIAMCKYSGTMTGR